MWCLQIPVMFKKLQLILILIIINVSDSIDEKTIIAIIKTNFAKGGLIVFNLEHANDTFYVDLNKLKYSLILLSKSVNLDVLNIRNFLSGYLFLGFEKKVLNEIIMNPRMHYLFSLDNCLKCEEILRTFQKSNIFNIHFIVNEKYITPIRDKCGYSLTENKIQIKLKRLDWNFNGCTYNVLTREWPPHIINMTYQNPRTLLSNFSDGLKIRLVRLLGRILNYKINFYSNITGTPSDYQHWLMRSPQYDMVIVANIPSLATHAKLSYSIPVVADKLVWMCPTVPKAPKYRFLLTIFNHELWIWIGIAFLAIITIYCAVSFCFDISFAFWKSLI